MLEALLEVASHPDNTICAMTFNFWHRLVRQVPSFPFLRRVSQGGSIRG